MERGLLNTHSHPVITSLPREHLETQPLASARRAQSMVGRESPWLAGLTSLQGAKTWIYAPFDTLTTLSKLRKARHSFFLLYTIF